MCRRTRNCLFAETDADHPFVEEEQMMPFIPIVRVKSVEEGIEARCRPSTITNTRRSFIRTTWNT